MKLLAAGDKRARHARGLAQCADVGDMWRIDSEMGQRSATVFTEHAKAVRIIHHQPGAVAFAQTRNFA